MEAKELRIGNIVGRNAQYLERGVANGELKVKTVTVLEPMPVIAIDRNQVRCELSGQWYILEPERLAGIPLTAEWLERFGFEKSAFIDIFRFKRFGIKENFIHSEMIGYTACIRSIEWVGIADIKYVHQLQNLYFALTGEELALKEVVK